MEERKRNGIFNKCISFIIIVLLIVFSSYGYSKNKKEPSAGKSYNNSTTLPLVLGIPGFRVPGVTIPQEEHFGHLKQILECEGVPYYCITYDSDNYPLPKVADLASDTYSIATTRVIPSIIRTINYEQARRKEKELPPVRDVTLFMYSQGTVVSYGFVRRLHYFRRRYRQYSKQFGVEMDALYNDPVLKSLISAINNYVLVRNIQVQRERDFVRDHDLRLFHDRMLEAMEQKYKELEDYLIAPSTLYPNVKEFEKPQTEKYPKKYDKLQKYAKECQSDPGKKKSFFSFLKNYARLMSIKDINFMYFSASGSIFGSPHANSGYGLLQNFPIGKFFVKGVNQIKDTRVGSFHHTQKISNLVRESKLPNYPINKKNTLFIVGANGEQGDDLVDQPSAHISQHCYVDLDLTKETGDTVTDKIKTVHMEVLPEQHVIPLEVHHFPVKTFWGLGPTLPGSAYMTEHHPVLAYLFPFIYKDFDTIEKLKKKNKIYLRQFMVEFTFRHITGGAQTDEQMTTRKNKLLIGGLLSKFIKDLDVKIASKPHNITIQGKYFNADNLTYVIVGAYKESFLYSDKPEEKSMDFNIRARGHYPITLTLPIKAGRIIFVNLRLRPKG